MSESEESLDKHLMWGKSGFLLILMTLRTSAFAGAWEGVANVAYPLAGPKCDSSPSSPAEEKRLAAARNNIVTKMTEKRRNNYGCSEKYIQSILDEPENLEDLASRYDDLIDIIVSARKDAQRFAAAETPDHSLIEKHRNFIKSLEQSLTTTLPFGDDSDISGLVRDYLGKRSLMSEKSGYFINRERLYYKNNIEMSDAEVLSGVKDKFYKDFKKALKSKLASLKQKILQDDSKLGADIRKGPGSIGRPDLDSFVRDATNDPALATVNGGKNPSEDQILDSLGISPDGDSKKAFCQLRKDHGEGAKLVDDTILIGTWVSLGFGKAVKWGGTALKAAGILGHAEKASGALTGTGAFAKASTTLKVGAYGAVAQKVVTDTCNKKFGDLGVTSPHNQDVRECRLYSTSDLDSAACGIAGVIVTAPVAIAAARSPAARAFLLKTGYSAFLQHQTSPDISNGILNSAAR